MHVSLESGLALKFAGDEAALIDTIKEGAGKVASVVPAGPVTRKVILRVDGTTRMGCVRRMTEALVAMDTARDVVASHEDGRAILMYAGDDELLVKAIADVAGKVAAVLTEVDVKEAGVKETADCLLLGVLGELGPVDLSSRVPATSEVRVELQGTLLAECISVLKCPIELRGEAKILTSGRSRMQPCRGGTRAVGGS